MKRKKNIWVVGASSGIGEAVARKLAEQGHFIICSARTEKALVALETDYPNNVKALPWDVSSDEDTCNRQLKNQTDVLDLVIYCAGICEYDDGPKLNIAMYTKVLDVNFLGLVRTLNIALPLLKKSKNNPRIAAVSSLAAAAAFPRAEIYGASKAALEYLMQSLKIDLAEHNIGVTIVRPGFVDTPLTRKNDFHMPMLMSVEEAATRTLKGIEKNRLFVEFPGPLSLTLGLARILPSFWLSRIAPRFRKMETL